MPLKRIIENTDTPRGKAFAWAIQILIVLSLLSFSIETLPAISPQTRAWLRGFEVFTIAVFTLEYLARVYVASNKRAFIFSFFGLIDLIAILPFYIAVGLDLRSIRVCRVFVLFRVLKIARYNAALARLHRAFILIREELLLFLLLTFIVLYLAGVGIYFFENAAQPQAFSSVFHSLWWAVATLTTVGYGDIYPITVGGKLFTFFILLVGLGIVAIPAGMVASALSKARELEE